MHDVQLRTANPVQRVMQWFASLRPVAFVFRHTFHLVDRALLRPLRGRTLSSVVAGIPNIMLTTTGARTGRLRTVPVIGVPVDDGIAVIGTRYGSEHQPGWCYNLAADPTAWVEQGDVRTTMVARSVSDGPEYESIFGRAGTVYSGFPKYRRRIMKRRIPIFVLEPAP